MCETAARYKNTEEKQVLTNFPWFGVHSGLCNLQPPFIVRWGLDTENGRRLSVLQHSNFQLGAFWGFLRLFGVFFFS